MSESITISKKTPESKSMQFDFLRKEGLEYIKKVAGKIWTDYNIHDPGVSILEVLAYAITELGYRASFDIKDLLANHPENETDKDIKNFFTAREILPNSPVTINDYRKLLIDTAVYDVLSNEHVGVKNAWIEKSKSNEIPVYVHKDESKLSYNPDPDVVNQKPLDIGILYDILLEFEKSSKYGDLNENTITKTLVIEDHADEPGLNGLKIKMVVEFPRWDNEKTDWDSIVGVKSKIQNISLHFSNVSNNYQFSYQQVNNEIILTGKKTTASDITNVSGIDKIETQINDFLFYNEDSVLAFYIQKINRIKEIVDAVKKRLHANRNLCEDFYKLSALKVEQIAVCADIQLARDADVEQVQAEIYHQIGKFLSPTVYFYTLDEMLDKCKKLHEFKIHSINPGNKYFEVDLLADELIEKVEQITISGSRSNDGEYSVKSISGDIDKSISKIYVTENISSDLLTDGESLSFYITNDDECLSVDQIFEGPALNHGFIDDNELEKADRRKVIHVSDLIQIIMDIKGVTSVKTIQIANIPQDNYDNLIESKSVKWCLQLAFSQNYVPRLSVLNSKITFYKDQLPFRASSEKVEVLLEEFEKQDRTPKLENPVLDFDIPKGKYRDPEHYESIQNDFPLTYGIGEEGIPNLGNDNEANKQRIIKAKQLKGFLMHFDQLLANYFSQLAHVKDLFSMNAEKDNYGNYKIGRTYYTQPLFEIVPNAIGLYVDKNGHEITLKTIAESDEDFYVRKNKFLDHLIGRFAEQFTDYALLTYKISGELIASIELVEDKLSFLNSYPTISSSRGKGFDQLHRYKLWNLDNVSGLRRRASYLTGIDEATAERLNFSQAFKIIQAGEVFEIHILNSGLNIILKSVVQSKTVNEAGLILENMVTAGLNKENYKVQADDGNHYFTLYESESEIIGISSKTDYPDNLPGGEMQQDIDELVQLFTREFFNNPESNRNNLACPLQNYIQHEIVVDMVQNPPVAIVNYALYSEPFSYNVAHKKLTGKYYVEGESKQEAEIISVDPGLKMIIADGNIAAKLKVNDVLIVEDSQDNDGVYTVVSATNAGSATEITVNETIPTNAAPFGELLYNVELEKNLLKKAEKQLPEILWQLIYNASKNNKYYFSSESGNYRFRIFNNYGIDLAESVETDFNNPLANKISNLVSGVIEISDSTNNNGEYSVVSASAEGEKIVVELDVILSSAKGDGNLGFSESFEYSVNLGENSFVIGADLTSHLLKGDKIEITGSESINGEYTIFGIQQKSMNTQIMVEETIPADDNTGKLQYSKTFKIESVFHNKIIFKGGYDLKAVDLFTDFIKTKFFTNEGFHVLEHVLLRPKVKGEHFVDVEKDTLDEGLADLGSLYFNKTLPLYSASKITNFFKVSGDLSADLDASELTLVSSRFSISETGVNDQTYHVKNVNFDAVKNRTTIKPVEEIHSNISHLNPYGKIAFLKGTSISGISPSNQSITVSDSETLNILKGEIVEIRGSSDSRNDGRFMVSEVIDKDAVQELVIDRVEKETMDDLFEIVLDDAKCDSCRIEDPYTCVASVIIPHWQGRFDNIEFRRFFEKQIRLEAPAHVFLVICWISCEQMTEFEKKYKAWLIENAKKVKDFGALSACLNDLLNIRSELRNVYPTGTLHDCEEDETLENAVILDNSVLGNA